MIFSNTLAQMCARELAQHLSLDHRDVARHVFATALFMGLAVGLSVVLLLLLVGPWLARHLFNLEAVFADRLALGFAFGAFGWLFLCLAGVFLSLFTARQDFARLAKISISATFVATLLQLLFIPLWPRASTFLACQAAGFATSLVAALWLTRRSLAEWLSMPALYMEPLRSLARVGSWQLAAQGGGVASSQADRYLLGAFLQTRHVGFYNVAQRLEEATIADTLESVARQTHSEIEHIVIDGASTDSTMDVINHHGKHVAQLISEPDQGIYDAMNKGLALATGDIIAYLMRMMSTLTTVY